MVKILAILWLGMLLHVNARADNTRVPEVMVTIKPIHALVSGIMKGVGTPRLLLRGGESPHTYSLRPSQLKELAATDILIWVSPALESFLEKFLTTLSPTTEQLRLIDVENLTLLKARQGGTWEDTHAEHAHHHETSTTIDPHIWLDPQNAKVMVQAITELLSKRDATNATRYKQNATQLLEQLEQLDRELQTQLTSIKSIPFLVFHDAYYYAEQRYGLKTVGVISVSPENRPSAKRLQALRKRIQTLQVRCLFSEPQFESTLVTTLVEKTTARAGTLDPIGATLETGQEAYFMLLRNLANSLKQCLLPN